MAHLQFPGGILQNILGSLGTWAIYLLPMLVPRSCTNWHTLIPSLTQCRLNTATSLSSLTDLGCEALWFERSLEVTITLGTWWSSTCHHSILIRREMLPGSMVGLLECSISSLRKIDNISYLPLCLLWSNMSPINSLTAFLSAVFTLPRREDIFH